MTMTISSVRACPRPCLCTCPCPCPCPCLWSSPCLCRCLCPYLRRFHLFALTRLTLSLNPRWLSRNGVSIGIDLLDENETPCQLSHRKMILKLNISGNSRKKLRILKKPFFDLWKTTNPEQKSHVSIPLLCSFKLIIGQLWTVVTYLAGFI